jgi:hypothetical protein
MPEQTVLAEWAVGVSVVSDLDVYYEQVCVFVCRLAGLDQR